MQKDKILQTNKEALRYCSKNFPLFKRYFINDKRVNETLKCIYKWLSKKDTFQYNGKNYDTFILTTGNAQQITGIKTRPTMNRYLNFFCFYGVLEKIKQTSSEQEHLIKANKEFVKKWGSEIRPLGVYKVVELNKEKLREIEELLEQYGQTIRKSNISDKRLRTNNLDLIADEQYYNNSYKSLKSDYKAKEKIIEALQDECDTNGYCTKNDLIKHLEGVLKPYYIDKIVSLFKTEISNSFNYKRPTKEEKERLEIVTNKFIYTKK